MDKLPANLVEQFLGKPQPSGSKWTREQWQAIATRGINILVAAAAGSGKTAVLVQRLIERLIDEQAGLDVDRLLVVTFTNAAAAEMRKRIGEALEEELKKQPHSLYLRRQLNLLPRSSISTLHSFCLEVIRRYYYQLELDPQFRIADETEIQLLREEVLEELFEEEYSGVNQEDFFALVERYSSDRSDAELQELVLRLYDFSRSHPWPDVWLEQMAARYQLPEEENLSLSALPWTNDILMEVDRQLQAALALVERAIGLAEKPTGPHAYLVTLTEDRQLIEDLLQIRVGEKELSADDWTKLYTALQTLSFGKLKPIKKGEVDAELQEKVKKLREQLKKQLTDLKETYFLRSPQDYLTDVREMAPYLQILVNLVNKFASRYEQEKRSRLLVDFADLEHYCLRILADIHSEEEGSLIPTAAALEYRDKFEEVLVDEYQDTNLVQEAIIQLVSQGNLFMVGDVKQSIYRFRLAEPSLFLEKYKQFTPFKFLEEGVAQSTEGLRIDLAKNFRSRNEVLAATNFIFKQVLSEQVGEMDYEPDAELIFGAEDYPEVEDSAAELLLIQRTKGEASELDSFRQTAEEDEEEAEPIGLEGALTLEELQAVQLEARLIAQKIKSLLGQKEGESPFQVYDRHQKVMRLATYRDIVILLRSTSSWAPIILEELKVQGIPAYAELQSGYFEAVEVSVMLSLLKVIDNPEQDIPLVAVLRSPIVGLSGEELAQVKLSLSKGHNSKLSFYEALKNYLAQENKEGKNRPEYEPKDNEEEVVSVESTAQFKAELYDKLQTFYEQLQEWRTRARQGALSELIWQIFRETGYYDFVSGMSEGKQRQANLRALYDRARQYEKTSFRGLFRFLRFIEKMQDRGGDLGTARALGEQEDVVRLMTIHKSKGLEFPIVFVAGLGKQFNQRDLYQKFLLHKELGLGTKFVDPILRVSYDSLPQLAIKQKLHLELLAEEMRILYVALTRAKEKLFLVGTVKDLEKEVEEWQEQDSEDTWLLPDYSRSKAKCYLDWLGPALLRHQAGEKIYSSLSETRDEDSSEGLTSDEQRMPRSIAHVAREIYHYPTQWSINIYKDHQFLQIAVEDIEQTEEWLQALHDLKPLPSVSSMQAEVEHCLSWKYAHPLAERFRAKQSVTEIKRQREARDEATDDSFLRQTRIHQRPIVERPRFLQKERLTATEKGTAMHMVMQHLHFDQQVSLASIQSQIDALVEKELLTKEEREVLVAEDFLSFCQSPLGKRMAVASFLEREIPFSMVLPAEQVYAEWLSDEEELVFVQGVIDALFEEEDGLVLVDYKSDRVQDLLALGEEQAQRELKRRYQVQIQLYEQAIQQIWKREVQESYLYFFDAAYCLALK